MVTTGIGRDISPETDSQTAFTIFVIILGVLMYAVIIGSLSSAVHSIDTQNNDVQKRMEQIELYMRKQGIPVYLRQAIREFYDYRYGSGFAKNVEEVFVDLPLFLKMRLKVSLSRHHIRKIKLFDGVSPMCMISLIQKLESVIALPKEYLMHQGKIGSQLYIIQKGKIVILTHKESSKPKGRWEKAMKGAMAEVVGEKNRLTGLVMAIRYQGRELKIQDLGENDYFGENCLVNVPNTATARVDEFSQMLQLSCEGMGALLHEFPELGDRVRQSIAARTQDIQVLVDLGETVGTITPGSSSGRAAGTAAVERSRDSWYREIGPPKQDKSSMQQSESDGDGDGGGDDALAAAPALAPAPAPAPASAPSGTQTGGANANANANGRPPTRRSGRGGGLNGGGGGGRPARKSRARSLTMMLGGYGGGDRTNARFDRTSNTAATAATRRKQSTGEEQWRKQSFESTYFDSDIAKLTQRWPSPASSSSTTTSSDDRIRMHGRAQVRRGSLGSSTRANLQAVVTTQGNIVGRLDSLDLHHRAMHSRLDHAVRVLRKTNDKANQTKGN
jgi:CRP-like cAMP-binding protein